MKQLFIVLFLLFTATAYSQTSTFSVAPNGNILKITNVSTGGFITTGMDSIQTLQCVRWNSGFSPLWSFKLPSTGFIPAATNVIEANDGNFYYTAYSSINNGSLTVFKLSPSGTLLWQKTYTGSSVNFGLYAPTISRGIGNDKGFIFGTGSCSLSNAVVKCDENGNIVWQKSFGFPLATGVITCASILTDGNQYIVSSSYNIKSLLTFKLDSLGNVISHTAYKYNETAQIFPIRIIKLTESAGYAIVSQCNNSNNQIQYVVFLNNNLNVTSFNELTIPYQQFTLNDIAAVEKGNVIVTGSVYDSTHFRACMIKVSNQGNVIWKKLGATMNETTLFYPYLDFSGITAHNNMTIHTGRGMTEGAVISIIDSAGNGLCHETPFELTNVHRTMVQEFGNVSNYGSTAIFNTASYNCTTNIPFSKNSFCGTLPNAIHETSSNDNGITYYPNPVNETLHIDVQNQGISTGSIDIVALDGKQVFHSNVLPSQTINTANWTPGMYIAILRNQTGSHYHKLLIQH